MVEKTFQEKFYDAFIKFDRWKLYVEGLRTTLIVALLAVIIGIVVGLIIAMIAYANKKTGKLKILNFIMQTYVTIIRGTPVVLQMLIMFTVFFVADLGDLKIGDFVWKQGIDKLIGGLTFGLNSGAYVSEIIRAGFESIDDGQMEAGRSLGLSMGQTINSVITPQAFRNVLPPLFNEFIMLVKETSILGYVGVYDLGKIPGLITTRTFETMMPLLISAVIYLVLVLILTLILKLIEKTLQKSDKSTKKIKVRGDSLVWKFIKDKIKEAKRKRKLKVADDDDAVLDDNICDIKLNENIIENKKVDNIAIKFKEEKKATAKKQDIKVEAKKEEDK